MFNNFTVVGRFHNSNEFDDKNSIIFLIVKNNINHGVILPFIVSKNMVDKMNNYMKKSDLVGIKGFISIKNNSIELIATNVAWLNQKNMNNY